MTTFTNIQPPATAPKSALAQLWSRKDARQMMWLFTFLFIALTIGAVAAAIALGTEPGSILFTALNLAAMGGSMAGTVLLMNHLRHRHSMATLGFTPTDSKWLLGGAALGGLLLFRGPVFEQLGEAFPILNVGLDMLGEILTFTTPSEIAFGILTVGIIVPIYEEFFFRSYVQSALASRWGRWVGIIGSGICFGFIHMIPLQLLAAIPVGIASAWLYDRTNSLYPSIALHIVNNMLAVVMMVFMAGG